MRNRASRPTLITAAPSKTPVAPESGTDTGRLEARMAEKAEIMGEAVGKDCAETVVVAAGLSAAWLKPAFLVE